MLKTVFENPWVRAFGLLLVLAAVGLLCYLLTAVLIPLLFAFLVAYLFDPLVDAFEVKRIPRGVTVAMLGFIGIGVLLLIPILGIPGLVSEADELISAAREQRAAGAALPEWFDGLVDKLPLERIVRSLGWANPEEEAINARAILAERIGAFVKENARRMLAYAPEAASAGRTVGAGIAAVVSAMGHGIVSVLVFLGNFAVFAFVAGYLLKDFDRVVEKGKGLVPPRHRTTVFAIVRKVDEQLHGFVRGQLTVCFGLGVMYAIGLMISGTPFAIPLAVFGAVASFIPYLGVILTIGPALLLTFLQNGLTWHLIGVVATFVLAQTVEGTVLTPKIVGDRVGLNPVWVILAIMVFGTALGFLGLLLAVPIAACLKVLVVEGVEYYKRSSVFRDAGSGEVS